MSGDQNCIASNGSSESSAHIVDLFDFSQDIMKPEGQGKSGVMGSSSEMSYLNPGTCLIKSEFLQGGLATAVQVNKGKDLLAFPPYTTWSVCTAPSLKCSARKVLLLSQSLA